MEEYQILNEEDTLVETDYEVRVFFEGDVDDTHDIEVVDLEDLHQQQPQEDKSETKIDSNATVIGQNKRKYSFVWRYFQGIEGTNQVSCVLCKSSIGCQTSNLARHLATSHNISRQDDRVDVPERPESQTLNDCPSQGRQTSEIGSVANSEQKIKVSENLVRIRSSNSFIWKYCTKEDSKHARCHLCNKTLYFGGGNTANIAKHLRRLHSDLINKQENSQDSLKMDDETMQATASLSNQTIYEEDNDGRSSPDMTSAERKERRGASYVWNYVAKLSRHTIRCKLCTKVMSFHGTANVITHLQRRHNVLGESGSQLIQTINAKQEMNQTIVEQSDNQDEYDNTEYGGKKFGRKNSATASIVWKYCTRISQDQVRCCFCKKNLSYQGTSNLQRHLHRMHGVITHGRINKTTEELVAVKADNFKLPTNVNFIWDFCTQEDEQRTRCNMCDSMFETKDTEGLVKHLAMIHSVETNQSADGRGETNVRRTKKRSRHVDYDTDEDDDDYDSKWSKMDDNEDQQIPPEFDETNIKKDDSLYDDIIEEDHNNYDEEPFDPSLLQDMPSANPLSQHSSRAGSPTHPSNQGVNLQNQQQQQSSQTPNLLPTLDTKVLLKLQEDRLRMETDYFREKAAFYRMQKYLTALQAKKVRIELERLSNGEATVVATADLNGAYAVEVIPAEHHQMSSQ